MPQVQPHWAPVQGQSVRGVATGQSAPSSSGTQGASASSTQTRATKAADKVAATAQQQPTTSRRGNKSQRGKRFPRGPPPLPPSQKPSLVYSRRPLPLDPWSPGSLGQRLWNNCWWRLIPPSAIMPLQAGMVFQSVQSGCWSACDLI